MNQVVRCPPGQPKPPASSQPESLLPHEDLLAMTYANMLSKIDMSICSFPAAIEHSLEGRAMPFAQL